MNSRQKHALFLRKTDLEGAIRRLGGNEDVYVLCLKDFLGDPAIKELNVSIQSGGWDEAFTAAHALKGMAGNMGFVPLMQAAGQLIIIIRGGRIKEIDDSLEQVNSCYRDIFDGIQQFMSYSDESGLHDED